MSSGRWAVGAAVLGLGLLLAPSGAADRKDPSIKEIMTKAHKGGNSLLTGVSKDLEADEPRWDDAREKTRELVRLGTSLGRLTPPLGGKESWATLTNRYVVSAKVLDASVQKKDRAAALAAHQQLRKQCAGCHKAHRKEAD
jgi:hypothetical protein